MKNVKQNAWFRCFLTEWNFDWLKTLNEENNSICSIDPRPHGGHALVSLHWLRVPERIQYKIAVLSYKVLHDTAPRYLGPLTLVADIPGRRALRCACTDRLEVPYFKLSTIGGRAFPVAASQIWNSLPDTVISAPTLRSFQHQLKTFFISTILHLLALY